MDQATLIPMAHVRDYDRNFDGGTLWFNGFAKMGGLAPADNGPPDNIVQVNQHGLRQASPVPELGMEHGRARGAAA